MSAGAEHISSYLEQAASICGQLDTGKIGEIAEGIAAARDNGGRLFVLGVGGSAGVTTGGLYSISVGEQALFGGTAPAVPDDPETPEDEYLNNAYSFSPYVYREHYEDREGNDAAYYVMSFAVAKDD